MYSNAKKLEVIRQLDLFGGHIQETCAANKISRSIFYMWMKDPAILKKFTSKVNGKKVTIGQTFKDLVEEITERSIDNIESSLYKNALEGDTTSIIFYLKTKGKNRGYVERTELTGKNGLPLNTSPKTNFDFSKFTEEELDIWENLVKKGTVEETDK